MDKQQEAKEFAGYAVYMASVLEDGIDSLNRDEKTELMHDIIASEYVPEYADEYIKMAQISNGDEVREFITGLHLRHAVENIELVDDAINEIEHPQSPEEPREPTTQSVPGELGDEPTPIRIRESIETAPTFDEFVEQQKKDEENEGK